MSASSYVHLEDCTIVRETADAFRVGYQGHQRWIPKSQVSDAGQYEQGDADVILSITEWIANKVGWTE